MMPLAVNLTGCGGSSGAPNATGGSGGDAGSVAKSGGAGGGAGAAGVGVAGSGGAAAGSGGASGHGGAAGSGGASGGGGQAGAPSGGAGGAAAGTDPTWAQWRMPNGAADVAAGAPNPESYTDNGDQTVTDNVTGLMWQQTVSTSTFYTLAQATALCSGLTLGGHNDWRIPTRIELMSLVDAQQPPSSPLASASIDATTFAGNLPFSFWTLSVTITPPTRSMVLDFSDGYIDFVSTDSIISVRCVRGGSAVVPAGPAPPGRYTYPATGTVYDTATGLTWQQTLDATQSYDWADAKTYCAALGATLGGTGWRLPTVTELETIVDETRADPSIDPTAFPGTPHFIFWTLSPVGTDPRMGLVVNFLDGNTTYYNLAYPINVRCVR